MLGHARARTHTHLSFGVAEDDGLCDGQRVVQVTQGVKLPLLSLHGDEELLDPLQGQLITAETRHRLEKEKKNTVRVLSVNFLVCIGMQLMTVKRNIFPAVASPPAGYSSLLVVGSDQVWK